MTANTLSEVLKYSITENCTINMNNIRQKEMNPFSFLRGGRNVDDQNVDRPKISERRNGLFS
jgi:hypothetical protein